MKAEKKKQKRLKKSTRSERKTKQVPQNHSSLILSYKKNKYNRVLWNSNEKCLCMILKKIFVLACFLRKCYL